MRSGRLEELRLTRLSPGENLLSEVLPLAGLPVALAGLAGAWGAAGRRI